MFNLILSTLGMATKYEKKQFYVLTFLIFLNSCLEILSIGVFVPFIDLFVKKNDTLNIFKFTNFSEDQKIIFFIFVIFFIFLFKFLFFLFVIFCKNNFLIKLNLNLSKEILENLVNKPVEFHLKNSSTKNTNLMQQVLNVTNNVSVLIFLIIDCLTLLFVVTFLLFFEFQANFIIFLILLIISISYYIFFKKKSFVLGEIKFKTGSEMLKNLQEIFLGIKEIKIFRLNKKSIFLYLETLKKFIKANNFLEIIVLVPKYFLEFLIIIFLSVFLGFLTLKGSTFDEILTKIAVSGFAFYKLLPLMNRLMVNIQYLNSRKFSQEQVLNFCSRNIKNYKKEKIEKKNINSIKLSFEKIIKIQDLSYSYKFDESKNNKINSNIINSLSCEIKKGEIIGLFGPSGSGKTTLINLLSGLLQPSSGQITIDSIDLENCKDLWIDKISYVSQNTFLFNDTIKFNITLEKDYSKINLNLLNDVIETVNLNLIFNHDKNINTNIGELGSDLSGGQKQRIAIARALYKNAQVLIFDEPTSALDEKSEQLLIQNILRKKDDKTIIFVSHRAYLTKYCDKVFNFENKKINIV